MTAARISKLQNVRRALCVSMTVYGSSRLQLYEGSNNAILSRGASFVFRAALFRRSVVVASNLCYSSVTHKPSLEENKSCHPMKNIMIEGYAMETNIPTTMVESPTSLADRSENSSAKKRYSTSIYRSTRQVIPGSSLGPYPGVPYIGAKGASRLPLRYA